MADLSSIMTELKEAGEEKLKSVRTSRGNETTKEIPPFILECFKTAVNSLIERQDNTIQELREEFEAKLVESENKYEAKLAEKDVLISNLQKNVRENYYNLDALSQYNRSENIKIHGIEYRQGEDTNKIVKDVAKYCGVPLSDSDISVSHRLMSREQMDASINPSNRDKKIPVIIARVTRRDLKQRLLEAKKTLLTNVECPPELKKATMYEDVTPLRSRIMYQLRQRNDKQAFKFVWSKAGRIYARTPEEAALPRDQQQKPLIINTPDDLTKAGFSEAEIEDIIKNPRKSNK